MSWSLEDAQLVKLYEDTVAEVSGKEGKRRQPRSEDFFPKQDKEAPTEQAQPEYEAAELDIDKDEKMENEEA